MFCLALSQTYDSTIYKHPNHPNPTQFGNRFSQQGLPAIEVIIHLGLVTCKTKAIILSITSAHENCVTCNSVAPKYTVFSTTRQSRVLGENVSGVAEVSACTQKKGRRGQMLSDAL